MPPLLLNTAIPFLRAYNRISYRNNMSQEFFLQYGDIWSLIWKFQMYCYYLTHIQVDQNHIAHANKYVMFHDINSEVFHLKFFLQIPYSFNYYSRYLIGSIFPSFDILSDIWLCRHTKPTFICLSTPFKYTYSWPWGM